MPQPAVLLRCLLACCSAACGAGQMVHAQDSEHGMTLQRVVVVGRHGVRSPLQTAGKLAVYSHDAWPTWDVDPGEVTRHGREAMKTLGGFYLARYRALGLLPGSGCPASTSVFLWSDTDARNRSTAASFAEGFAPGCTLVVHALAGSTVDPVIHVLKAHVGHPDRFRATAEVLGRVGGNGDHVLAAYRPALLTLDRVLGGCGPALCPGETPGRVIVPSLHTMLQPADDDDHLLRESKGALGVASTLSEILLLEYADGKPMREVGFGRMTRADLTAVLALHAIEFDLVQETDYPARVQASNLAVHILHALLGERGPADSSETFSTGGAKFVYVAAHDTNLANLAGLLRVHWFMSDDQADAAPPGGALVFELWHRASDDTDWVRLHAIAQTLDQLRANSPLTAQAGPEVLPVWIPECSSDSATAACSMMDFKALLQRRVLPEFVTP